MIVTLLVIILIFVLFIAFCVAKIADHLDIPLPWVKD